MRENFRVAIALLAIAGLALPGVLNAYDYDSNDSDVVLRITDEIDLTLTGEVRTRMEWNDNLTDFTDDADDEFGFVPSRVRLGVGLTLPRDVEFYVEAQELFSFGEDTPARLSESLATIPGSAATSGSFIRSTHRDDLSLYKAYIGARNIGDTNFSLRAGRQTIAFGNEWLLGDADFYGGTSLDALHGWWEFDRGNLSLFWAKLDENNTGASDPDGMLANATDDDTDLYGAYYVHPEIGSSLVGFDVYGVAAKSNFDNVDGGPDGGADNHDTNFTSYWVGARFYRQPEWGFHFNVEGTYQFGDVTTSPTTEDDIEAFGFEGMVGYTFDVTGNPDIHGGVTWATGDDDPADGDSETFFTVTQDPHPRLGFADLFTASNLVAYQLGYAGSWENLAWGVELYQFELEEEGAGGEDDLGQEVDLWFSYQYSRNLSLQIAYSYFSLGDAIEDSLATAGLNDDDAQRFYVNVRLLM